MERMMNQLLEIRFKGLRDALDELSANADDNLRSVLLRLTCDKTIAQSAKIAPLDDLAHLIRERTLLLIAREHPLANDLKFAMAALRVGQDYERINELTISLCKRTERLAGSPVQDVLQDMTGIMADILALHEVIRKTWHSAEGSTGMLDLKRRADEISGRVHAQISSIQSKIMGAITGGVGDAENFVEIVLACRHLKRIATTMQAIPEEIHAFDKAE
jgi:phosphate transport system protein